MAVAGAAVTAAAAAACSQPSAGPSALRVVARIPLPGDSSRFDYASLDSGRGLLFAAHLGASEVLEVNVRTREVVRTITGLPQVHGVLVVPALHRVYATATAANAVVAISEDTGRVLSSTPTGDYPDGLAYDPANGTIWTTNESGGSETIIDAATGAPRGTVALGGEAGNVAYDPASGHMLADVQTRNQLAVINPATRTIIRRVPLPGCDHDHGLNVDSPDRLAFIACDGNAALLTLDLSTWQVTGTAAVGDGPDVLAYDPHAGRLYVAAESGWVTILQRHSRRLHVINSGYLTDNAHVVAVDPATGRSYYPVPTALGGRPALLICTLA
jgi:DNA-binding beta-propeller fold protein YncE